MKMLFIAEVFFFWLNHLCFAVTAGSKMGPNLPPFPWVQNQWQFSFILFKWKTDISVGSSGEDYGWGLGGKGGVCHVLLNPGDL